MADINLTNVSKLSATKQVTANCCWAACGSALSKYFAAQGYGKAYEQTDIADGIGTDITEQASIEDVLVFLGCYEKVADVEVDEQNLPDTEEISKELKSGRPLVAGINQRGLRHPKTMELRNAHYMIIIGVDDENGKLWIMDPSQGNLQKSTRDSYSQNSYNEMKFAKTFYTNIPSK